jgi:hypothetical protein
MMIDCNNLDLAVSVLPDTNTPAYYTNVCHRGYTSTSPNAHIYLIEELILDTHVGEQLS